MTSAVHQPGVKRPPQMDRRAHAFWVGEQYARNRRITTDSFVFLYKELVRLAGDRTFCWPGQEFLVESLNTSKGTLKRWFRELEQADLIRRVARAGGQTTITYITVYVDENAITLPTQQLPEPEPDADVPPAPLFFVPEQGITSDPDGGSHVIHHTVKTQKKKIQNGGGGVQASNEPSACADERDALIEHEGILDPPTVADLRALPLPELLAVSAYLDRQTNVRSRASLFAWLARGRFGRSLLNGRRSSAAPTVAPAPPTARPTASDDAPEGLWQTVLDELRGDLAPDVFRTWLAPTVALLVDPAQGVVVVGTPNVFVRDELANHYHERLQAAASRAAGRPMRLELVIGD